MSKTLEEYKYVLDGWKCPDNENTMNAYVLSLGNHRLLSVGIMALWNALNEAVKEIERLQKEIEDV